MDNTALIEELARRRTLPAQALAQLLTTLTEAEAETLYVRARAVREAYYGRAVYLRGLIEFSNICRNDCRYCGIRRSNGRIERYRLTAEEILACCDQGHALGFRTFVLQSGEDTHYTDDALCALVARIKHAHPDCAVTLSLGEKAAASYQAYFDAGADRYLLRQETTDPALYARWHPEAMRLGHRLRCLETLKRIGYQVGAGIMVGAPGQTVESVVADLFYMQAHEFEMVGIGPFIPHKDTPFKAAAAGTLEDTLHLLAVIRLMMPRVLLPATTALGTIHPLGREKGLLAGANVVMPNLSPPGVRSKYMLYDGKICTGDEAAECRLCMERRIASAGCQVEVDRGDYCFA